MGVVDFATAYKTAITAGQAIEGTAVKSIIADSGATIAEGTQLTVVGGNGTGATVYSMTTAVEGTSATTTGVGLLALDLGVAGAAIAPLLGVVAGVGLYNLAPEFWTNVSNALVNAGKTIGGKIIAYTNGDNIYFDDDTIEIFKNQLVATGQLHYATTGDLPEGETFSIPQLYNLPVSTSSSYKEVADYNWVLSRVCKYTCILASRDYNEIAYRIFASNEPFTVYRQMYGTTYQCITLNIYGVTLYYWYASTSGTSIDLDDYQQPIFDLRGINWSIDTDLDKIVYTMVGGELNPVVQPDAVLPDANTPFPLSYPDYLPLEYPQTVPHSEDLPKIYPAKYPEIDPNPYPDQQGAQNPEPESVPEFYPAITPNFDLPQPETEPQPQPEPDPETGDEPEPIKDTPNPDTPSDPVDPNPDPVTPPTPIVPVNPDSVTSGKLFTVYNPTSAQLNSLGGYLWNNSIMETIKKIWQDPLDGIISLIQVYATPSTSGTSNIILGYLDTGVSGVNVVSNQFTHIDCGSVQVKEDKKNATDYSPYTSLHLFLPFIGVVELDVNEFMNGTISVSYDVDVYTGTCLAKVKCTRAKDMPNETTIYTYSGNCSQQIPLTSGNATGMLTALVGGVTAGLSVATGGGLGVVAGASMVGQSLTHEMFHVSHGGNISANAGIMGEKIPYLILARRHGYDANNYNAFYGFPANKTAYLNNHTGFVRCKVTKLQTSATDSERERIESFLQNGVYI